MTLLVYFTASLLLGLGSTAPTSNDEDKIYITEDFFDDNLAIYTADHDIVNILISLNYPKVQNDTIVVDASDNNVFFVLADNENGYVVDQGLYIRKNDKVIKLLDNGRDISAANDGTNTVYFGAKDGLYIYNEEEIKAEKYGTITDSIINIAKVKNNDLIYVLTEDHVLYKVTEKGTKKEKIEEVVNAQKIVLDSQDYLYYYTPDKNIYVLKPYSTLILMVKGLPEEASFIDILRPPFVLEAGIPVIVDNTAYFVYSDGNADLSNFEFKMRPTAYSMEATLVQYFAFNKKIYEYDLITILTNQLYNDVDRYKFIDSKFDTSFETDD